jgi:hypothetical protein
MTSTNTPLVYTDTVLYSAFYCAEREGTQEFRAEVIDPTVPLHSP